MRNLILTVSMLGLFGCASYLTQEILVFDGKLNGQKPISKTLLQKASKATLATWVYQEEKAGADLIAIGNANTETGNSSRACLKITTQGSVMVFARSHDKEPAEIYLESKDAGLIPQRKWTHVAAIIHYDEDRIQMFVDGVEIATKEQTFKFENNQTPNTPSHLAALGGEENGVAEILIGKMTNVIVSSNAYSKRDIERLFKDKP